MATYTGAQSLHNAALGEYADYGFSLREDGDHILELSFKDKVIARLNQTKVTIPIIQEGCHNYLANILRHERE